MTCANCTNKALYEYKITAGTSVLYCNAHLPKFLEARKIASLLPLTDSHTEVLESALNILSVKSEDTTTTPPGVEPVKKAVKKQAK